MPPSATLTVPQRTRKQRMSALERANMIRFYRATVKRDLKAGRLDIGDLLTNEDPLLDSMKVFELLLAVPKIGRVKASKVFVQLNVSPSKTVGGLTTRQRRALALAFWDGTPIVGFRWTP